MRQRSVQILNCAEAVKRTHGPSGFENDGKTISFPEGLDGFNWLTLPLRAIKLPGIEMYSKVEVCPDGNGGICPRQGETLVREVACASRHYLSYGGNIRKLLCRVTQRNVPP